MAVAVDREEKGLAVAPRRDFRRGTALFGRDQKRLAFNVFRYAVLLIWLVIVVFPLFWIVGTAFKPDHEWFAWPPVYWSETPTLRNFMNVWGGVQEYAQTQYIQSFQRPWVALQNSLVVSLTATSLAVFFGSIIAYGVSRYRILSETRMFQLLMLRMVPPIVIVAPLSLYYAAFNMLDTVTGLVIIYFVTTLPYAVWMTKSFIDEVPTEIEQAAEILGASRWRTVFEIVLPLVRSGLVATFLFILILTWSEYLLALILSKTEVVTLPVELSKYQGSSEGRVYGRQAALAIGITLPLILIGFLIRKHLARGFSFGMVRR
jgi:multiple sugar transport system permease protein